jgi:hypothetical protein
MKTKQKHDKRTLIWRRQSTYAIWHQMLQRCLNGNHESYSSYGGRGIQVYVEWIPSLPDRPSSIAFRNFVRDMGLRPNQHHSLDRIDPNGNYEPLNLRWAQAHIQARNKRESLYLPDPTTGALIPAAELAQKMGLRYQTLRYRLLKAGQWPGTVYGDEKDRKGKDDHHEPSL